MSNCSPPTDQRPASPPSRERERDELPLPSKLLLHDVIWYGISLWTV